jgi:hypothetical protein
MSEKLARPDSATTRADRLALHFVAALVLPLLGLACSSGSGARADGGVGGMVGTGGAGGGRPPQVDATSGPDLPHSAPDASTDAPATNESPGRRTRSVDDGASWTDDVQLEANGGDDNDLLRTVIWGNQEFVAIGWRTMTSADGKTWKDNGVLGQWMGAAVYAQGQYVALGGFGLRSTSPDAITWKNHSIDTIATHAADALVYVPDHGSAYLGANDNGQRTYSADGVTWVAGTGVTATATTELAFGGGVAVALGGTAVLLSRDAGATWTAGGTLASSCQGIIYAQGHFTARANGHIFTSTDGAAWTDHPAAKMTTGSIAYGHGTYVILNAVGSTFSRSTDGLTWEQPIASSGNNSFAWITFGPTG